MTSKDHTDFPISTTHPFKPTLAFYLHTTKSTRTILDLTPQLLPAHPSSLNPFLSHDIIERAKTLHISSDAPAPIFTLHKENLLGTHLIVKDGEGVQVAEWKSPVLNYGTTTIKFPASSEHSETDIQVKPVGVFRRAESFVKDSILYIWDVDKSHHEHKTLFKVLDGERREIARYGQRNNREKEGVLMVDGGEVDDLVAVLTVCAMLDVRDSFAA